MTKAHHTIPVKPNKLAIATPTITVTINGKNRSNITVAKTPIIPNPLKKLNITPKKKLSYKKHGFYRNFTLKNVTTNVQINY